ncbi:MAG: hypothetical protein ACJ71K_08210 [Nitrososphaeraceae archaeon]
MSNSIYLQQGDLTSNKTKTLMQDSFLNIDSIVDHLFIVNKTNIITIERICTSSRKTLAPVFSFSSIFMGLDGNYRIGINYSIINRETGQYMGVVGSAIPTENFAHYGNIHDINSRFLVVFDRNGIMLANGASKTLVERPFLLIIPKSSSIIS